MIKAVGFLKRRPDLPKSDYDDWWVNRHGPLAAKMPNVKRYLICPTIDDGCYVSSGVGQLWFDDVATAEASYASPQGQLGKADVLEHVEDRYHIFCNEHLVFDSGERPPFKLLVARKRLPEESKSVFGKRWLDDSAQNLSDVPGLRRREVSLDETDNEGVYDGIEELWFDTADALVSALKSEPFLDLIATAAKSSAASHHMPVIENVIVGGE